MNAVYLILSRGQVYKVYGTREQAEQHLHRLCTTPRLIDRGTVVAAGLDQSGELWTLERRPVEDAVGCRS